MFRPLTPHRNPSDIARMALVISLSLTLVACADMTQPGFYNMPKASSATDAEANATDAYALQSIRAPSQIQIDLRQPSLDNQIPVSPPTTAASAPTTQTYKLPPGVSNAPGTSPNTPPSGAATSDIPPPDLTNNAATGNAALANMATAQAALIPEPISFAGTLPCFNAAMQCTAQRIMLTLAPNGRWRARATYLEQNAQSGKPQAEQGCWRTLIGTPTRVAILTAQGTPRAEFAAPSDNLLKLVSLNGQTPNLAYTLSRQPDLDPIKELDLTPAPNCP